MNHLKLRKVSASYQKKNEQPKRNNHIARMWLFSDWDYRLEYTNRCSTLGFSLTKILFDILGARAGRLGIGRFARAASDKDAKDNKTSNLQQTFHCQLLNNITR